MFHKKHNVSTQETLVGELNSQVTHLKEEIRSAFSRHRKSLESREQWLLDQADSIKEGTRAVIVKQQLSYAELKARLEESVKFMKLSKARQDADGVQHSSDVMAEIQTNVKECIQSQDSQIPVIRFVHDRAFLQTAILSYGKLETDDDDDVESCSTEKSWDFADEKGDVDKNSKEICMAESGPCCKQVEIEDMDFTAVLCEEDGGSSYVKDELKNVCKANELCSSISECVCETPCLVASVQMPNIQLANIKHDPVSQLHQKLGTFLANDQKEDRNFASSSPLPASLDQADEDPLTQISLTVQNILSSSEKDEDFSPSFDQSCLPKETDFVDDLHQKLQGILDGNVSPTTHVGKSETTDSMEYSDVDNRVGYKSLPWTRGSDQEQNDGQKEGYDVVMNLKERFAQIFQGDTASDACSAKEVNKEAIFFHPDPVLDLSAKLQKILSC